VAESWNNAKNESKATVYKLVQHYARIRLAKIPTFRWQLPPASGKTTPQTKKTPLSDVYLHAHFAALILRYTRIPQNRVVSAHVIEGREAVTAPCRLIHSEEWLVKKSELTETHYHLPTTMEFRAIERFEPVLTRIKVLFFFTIFSFGTHCTSSGTSVTSRQTSRPRHVVITEYMDLNA